MAHGLRCSVACGIFPDQGLKPCPLHWQADSQPLHHQGRPCDFVLKHANNCTMQEDLLWPKCLPWAYGMSPYQIPSNRRRRLGLRGVKDLVQRPRNSNSGLPTPNPTFLPPHGDDLAFNPLPPFAQRGPDDLGPKFLVF